MNWAYCWRTKRRKEQEQQYLTIDPHSPPEFRANIVRNLDEFHEVFETTPGDGAVARPRGPRPDLVTRGPERGQPRGSHRGARRRTEPTPGVGADVRRNLDYMITNEALERVRGWFTGRLPSDWQAAPAEITVDREEITVLLTLPDVELADGVSRRGGRRGPRRPGEGASARRPAPSG